MPQIGKVALKGDAFCQNRGRGFFVIGGIVKQDNRQLSPIHGLGDVGSNLPWYALGHRQNDDTATGIIEKTGSHDPATGC